MLPAGKSGGSIRRAGRGLDDHGAGRSCREAGGIGDHVIDGVRRRGARVELDRGDG